MGWGGELGGWVWGVSWGGELGGWVGWVSWVGGLRMLNYE